jgi:hypothetical protein
LPKHALQGPRQPTVESRCGAVTLGRTYPFAAPFVWRCLRSSPMAPFPHPAHRTGRADFRHPALGQDITPSPTAGHVPAQPDARDRSTRRGARVDRSRSCFVRPYACCATTGAPAGLRGYRAPGMLC